MGQLPNATLVTLKLETPGAIATETPSLILEKPSLGVASVAGIGRINGLVQTRNLIDLITELDLESNPRDSKVGPVTKAIHKTLANSPDLMPFNSKGILLAASQVDVLPGPRVQLGFEDLDVEGILDGGHNTLAIALYLLGQTSISAKDFKRIKTWGDMKAVWGDYLEELKNLAEDGRNNTALVPVEILCPANSADSASVAYFNEHLLQICTARNNNAQLKQETTANQMGLLDPIKEYLPEELKGDVEWRTNAGGRLNVKVIVALLWVALGKLDLPNNKDGDPITPVEGHTAYSNKSTAFERYMELVSSPEVSEEIDGDYRRLMTNPSIQSALQMLPTLLRLSDLIQKEFANAYNKTGGSYGRITAVQSNTKAKNMQTRYFAEELKQPVPDGFLNPMVYGLRALMTVHEEDGVQRLEWAVEDPEAFVRDNLVNVMGKLRKVMESFNWDPQPVGKKGLSYEVVYDAMDNAVLRAGR